MITEDQIAITEQFAESCIRNREEDGLPGEHIPSVTALALCAEWRENKRRTEGFAAELEKLFPDVEKPSNPQPFREWPFDAKSVCCKCGQVFEDHRCADNACPSISGGFDLTVFEDETPPTH